MNYAIPMKSRYFSRTIWTIRCFLEYRSRFNGNLFRGFSNDPWTWRQLWELAESSAANEADSNDKHGWAWDSPVQAVQNELECWTE